MIQVKEQLETVLGTNFRAGTLTEQDLQAGVWKNINGELDAATKPQRLFISSSHQYVSYFVG